MEIKDDLENQFEKLSSLWNRPGIEDVFNSNDIIKVYYSAREDIDQINPETPNWKCGFHDISEIEIYLSPLSEPFQASYYTNLQNLAINEFSQLAISKKLIRENNQYFPPYFLEGFGLYESGFRPRRDSVLQYLNENPVPDFNFLVDTLGISNTLKRDLIIGNIEGQLLTTWSYLAVNAGASSFIIEQWPNYLNHFYKAPDNDRIKLLSSSANFDFYGAVSDSSHHAEVISYFENAYSFYIQNYNFTPSHRFNVVICPDPAIGGDLTGWGLLNGGAGCGGDLVIELSPNFNYDEEIYYSEYFGYNGMCAHEFFHIYYNHFMWEIPGGFWAEGTADFSQRHSLGWEIPPHSLWKIEWLFTDYADQYNVDIDLEHISTNPNNEIDIYFFGDMFFEYLFLYHGGYEEIMEFFNEGMNYSVFDATYNEIDEGYINFLHSLNSVIAEFEADNLNPTIEETVNFTDLSTNVPSAWGWSFSPSTITFMGGTNANSQNPKVRFDVPDIYTVELIATNNGGSDTEIKNNYINAGNVFEVIATATPEEICVGSSALLQSFPSGGSGNNTFLWTSDPSGFTSNEQNVSAYPEVTTTYTVEVDDGNQTVSADVLVTVNPLPVITLGDWPENLCHENEPPVQLTAIPTGGIYSGQGITTDGLFDPEIAPLGWNVITYTFEDAFGCENFAQDSIFVDDCVGIFKAKFGRMNLAIFPNPFTISPILEYELKQPEKVRLTIYNQMGKQVYQIEENQPQGKQQLIWNTEGYADGVYYYRLQVGDEVANGKMVKVK